MSGQPKTDDRTGKYGGDDGALEHEREELQPGETGKTQAERKQDEDLASGEEQPG